MRINTLTSVWAQAHYTAQPTAASSVISNCVVAAGEAGGTAVMRGQKAQTGQGRMGRRRDVGVRPGGARA